MWNFRSRIIKLKKTICRCSTKRISEAEEMKKTQMKRVNRKSEKRMEELGIRNIEKDDRNN